MILTAGVAELADAADSKAVTLIVPDAEWLHKTLRKRLLRWETTHSQHSRIGNEVTGLLPNVALVGVLLRS